jgi:L-aminopeptidase/D-esterase-like protein
MRTAAGSRAPASPTTCRATPTSVRRQVRGQVRRPSPVTRGRLANTVIGVVVTDARLTKLEAHRVADLAHSGIARAVRPAHTQLDGDALFTLATGTVDAGPTAVDLVAALAADAVAEAVRRAVRAAKGDATLPGLADGPPDG